MPIPLTFMELANNASHAFCGSAWLAGWVASAMILFHDDATRVCSLLRCVLCRPRASIPIVSLSLAQECASFKPTTTLP